MLIDGSPLGHAMAAGPASHQGHPQASWRCRDFASSNFMPEACLGSHLTKIPEKDTINAILYERFF